jgi:hypothetical protein
LVGYVNPFIGTGAFVVKGNIFYRIVKDFAELLGLPLSVHGNTNPRAIVLLE